MSVSGKAVIVTGAAGLVGREVALAYLRGGASVVIADRDSKGAEETLTQATTEGFGDQAVTLAGDVTQETHVAALVDLAVTRFGKLDVMVNNAGGPGAMVPLLDMEVADYDATLAMLTRSVFLGIKHAGRHMRDAARGGLILSTASASAYLGGISPSLYGAAKAMLIRLTEMAAVELGPYRIRVNTVSPGAVWGPGFAYSGFTQKSLAAYQALPDIGTPADAAAAMVALSSDALAHVTGMDFRADGGLVPRGGPLFGELRRGAAAARQG